MPDIQQLLQQPLQDAGQQWPPAGIGALMNPMPLVRGVLRGARDIGVGGANAGLDMAGVPQQGFQSPIQSWIDRQLAEPQPQAPQPPQQPQTNVPAPQQPMPALPPGVQGQQNQQLTPDMMQLMMQMLYASPPKQPQQPQMPQAMPQQVM